MCATAGQLQDGMLCSTTISRVESEMTMDEVIEFLQASETHGPALCQSSKDWTAYKSTLQSACLLLGTRCKKKVAGEIKSISDVIEKLIGDTP